MEGLQVIDGFRGDNPLAASTAPSQSCLGEQEQEQELLIDRKLLPSQTPASNLDSTQTDNEEDKHDSPLSSEVNTNTLILTPPTRRCSTGSIGSVNGSIRSTESVAGSVSTEDFESWDAEENHLSALEIPAKASSITDLITSKTSDIAQSSTDPGLELRQTTEYIHVLADSIIYSIPIAISRQAHRTDPVTADHLEDEQTANVVGADSGLQNIINLRGNALNLEIFRRLLDPLRNMDPEAHGVLSTFICHHESLSLKAGQRGGDSRSWTVGFDVALFTKSARNFPTSKPIHCPYKLRGTHHEYEAYGRNGSQWNRRREVGQPILSILQREGHEAPVAPDFGRIADAFFSGREVPLEFGECVVNEIIPDETKAYEIHYKVGDYTKMLNMDLFEDKKLLFFLQDCAMANNLEFAYLQKGAASNSTLSGSEGSIKVYRDDKHKKYSNLIAQAENNDIVPGNPTASGYTVIAILHPNIELRNLLGTDATANTSDPVSVDELVKQLAGSVPQQPTEPPKPKKKKNAKKNKKAHKQAVEPIEPLTDVQSEQDDKSLAEALLAETISDSKESEVEITKSKPIVDSSSGKSFFLPESGGTANSKAGKGWETVKSRVSNKQRGASAQVYRRPGISQTYAPRPPSLQFNPGNSSIQPPFQVSAPLHIPRGPASQYHQRSMGGGERMCQGEAASFQNKAAATTTSTTAQSIQSIPGSKDPQAINKNQKTTPRLVGEKACAASSTRVFDPSEYPAMPSKPQVSNKDVRANDPIAHEVAESLKTDLPDDTILTPDSLVKSCPSIGSEQSFEVKQPIKAPGDLYDERSLAADTSTIVSESETDETPEPSVLAESEKTIDDFHGISSSVQDDETLDENSTEAVEQSEGSLPVDDNDETPEGSVDLMVDLHSDEHSSSEVVTPVFVDSTQMTPNAQEVGRVSSQAEPEVMITNNDERERDSGNGREMVEPQHEVLDKVPASENQSVVSMAGDLSTVTNQPSFNTAPTFEKSLPLNYPSSHQLGWESPHHNLNMAYPLPAPFYPPLGGMPVGMIPPYVGPPGPIPYQSYNAGPQFHPSQLPPFTNHNLSGFNENSHPMTFGHFTNPDATIRHPRSGSPPQSAPYSPLEVPDSLNMDVVSVDGGVDETQPAPPDNAFRCAYCRDPSPTDGRTLVFCPGCGPTCNIRYCSTACLLADSYDHSTRCMNFPASQRLAFHDLPRQFIYEKEPIMPISGLPQSPEQFRQKAYMMYCRSGSFPTTLASWARRNSAESSLQGIDILERQKRAGDYHVFRSELTSVGPCCNAGADVIFTVILRKDDPAKKIFNRSLNACFLTYRHEIVKFLFFFIRHFITDVDLFQMLPHQTGSTVVLEEFKEQFTREFGFNVRPYEHGPDVFSVTEECGRIEPFLADLETKYPILQHWMRD